MLRAISRRDFITQPGVARAAPQQRGGAGHGLRRVNRREILNPERVESLRENKTSTGSQAKGRARVTRPTFAPDTK